MFSKIVNALFNKVNEAVSEQLTKKDEPASKPQEQVSAPQSAPVVSAPQLSTTELQKKIVATIQNIPGCTVECDVPATRFCPTAHVKAKPISVLASKEGKPVLAIAIVKMNTYKSMPVVGTKRHVEDLGISYIRFFEESENKEDYIADRLKKCLA